MNIRAMKIAVGGLAVLNVWLFMQVPSVGDVVLSFLMAGIVPGRSQTVTPEGMLRLFGIGLTIVFLLVFWRQIVQLMGSLVRHRSPKSIRIGIHRPAPVRIGSVSHRQSYQHILRPVYKSTGKRIRVAGSILLHGLHASLWAVRRCTQGVKSLYTLLGILWCRARPYCEQLDRWLDRTLHRHPSTAALLTYGGAVTATIHAWLRAVQILFRRVVHREVKIL